MLACPEAFDVVLPVSDLVETNLVWTGTGYLVTGSRNGMLAVLVLGADGIAGPVTELASALVDHAGQQRGMAWNGTKAALVRTYLGVITLQYVDANGTAVASAVLAASGGPRRSVVAWGTNRSVVVDDATASTVQEIRVAHPDTASQIMVREPVDVGQPTVQGVAETPTGVLVLVEGATAATLAHHVLGGTTTPNAVAVLPPTRLARTTSGALVLGTNPTTGETAIQAFAPTGGSAMPALDLPATPALSSAGLIATATGARVIAYADVSATSRTIVTYDIDDAGAVRGPARTLASQTATVFGEPTVAVRTGFITTAFTYERAAGLRELRIVQSCE